MRLELCKTGEIKDTYYQSFFIHSVGNIILFNRIKADDTIPGLPSEAGRPVWRVALQRSLTGNNSDTGVEINGTPFHSSAIYDRTIFCL